MNLEYYEGQIYRPPSESQSLIVQITTGCSYNQCIYCSMFKTKKYRIKSPSEIREALSSYRNTYGKVRRIFLADGDAMALPYSDLYKIVESVNEIFPECERISAYGSVRNLSNYSTEELFILNKSGLSLIYIGVESGSDQILKKVNKGHSREMILKAAEKTREAGMVFSVSIICGLGGKELAEENAVKTAEVINIINPRYLGILRLTIDPGTPIERLVQKELFNPQSEYGIIKEMHTLISKLELSDCIVRSNHVCNYVYIGGTLGKDKNNILEQLNRYLGAEGFSENV